MPDLYDIAQQHRDLLLKRDRATTREVIAAYGKAWRELRESVRRLTDQIAAERAAGRDVAVSWLYDRSRLEMLERQVLIEIDLLSRTLEGRVAGEQGTAAALAQEHTALQVAAGGVSLAFASLPSGAVQSMIGFTADGSPLRSLLGELGPDAASRIRTALINGVATGASVRDIAAASRKALGGNMARALRISRSEVLRSYREASHQTRLQNREVLRGWLRIAALSSRTCAACLALHGSVHRLEERLKEHTSGRCVAIPLVKGDTLSVESGVEWFDAQGTSAKELVLGKGGAAAYEAGAVTLKDFVGLKRSREWGSHQYAKSLRQVLGSQKAREWITKGATA